MFVVALLFLVLICLYRIIKVKEKHFLYVFFSVAIISRVILALLINAYPISDFKLIFEAAIQAILMRFQYQQQKAPAHNAVKDRDMA